MARHGRGFPLGTQYLFTPFERDPFRITGTAQFALNADGSRIRLWSRIEGQALFVLLASGAIGVPGAEFHPAVVEHLSGPLHDTALLSGPLYVSERVTPVRRINRKNDYLIVRRIRVVDDSTGTLKPATGLTGLFGWISATEDGTEIHASLKVALAERQDAPGTYFGKLQGSDLQTHLAALDGQLVYERVQLNDNDYDDFAALLVEGPKAVP